MWTGIGLLTGFILSLISIFVITQIYDPSEAVIIGSIILFILNMVICPLLGLIISWLVILFRKQFRVMAWVIGALVPLLMMAFVFLSFEYLVYEQEILILGLIYVAIGVWIADRVFKKVSRDRSRVKTPTLSFYVSVAALVIVAFFLVTYIFLPGLLSFPAWGTTYETHMMQFIPNEGGDIMGTCAELVFVNAPDYSIIVCSEELYDDLKNETKTILQVDFRATKKITDRDWTYMVQSVGSWSGSLEIMGIGMRGFAGLNPDLPFEHKTFIGP